MIDNKTKYKYELERFKVALTISSVLWHLFYFFKFRIIYIPENVYYCQEKEILSNKPCLPNGKRPSRLHLIFWTELRAYFVHDFRIRIKKKEIEERGTPHSLHKCRIPIDTYISLLYYNVLLSVRKHWRKGFCFSQKVGVSSWILM